jgi:hypothetical protein
MKTHYGRIALFIALLSAAWSSSLSASPACDSLTQARLNGVTALLNNALLAAQAPGIPSAGDGIVANLQTAKTKWLVRRNFYQNQPSLTSRNIALSFAESATIEFHEYLINPRWRATALAYNFSVTNQIQAKKYLALRYKIQQVIYAADKLAQDGAECGINGYMLAPLTTFNPAPPFHK